jgi:uncharacterized protein involved in response to NO
MSPLQQLGAKGFRPFFLLAGAFAAVAIPLWVWSLTGGPAPGGVLQGTVWHAHEMIFGFTLAVIAGFLLTAVQNWTGQPTLKGRALLLLAGTWLAARVLLWWPGWVGPVVDLAVIPQLALGIGRPLWATRNKRNLPFVALLGGLWVTNLLVYVDAGTAGPGAGPLAQRIAVHLMAVIILVMAGRVVPMFTRNTTGDARVRSLMLPDRVAIGATLALAALQHWPSALVTGVVAAVAGVATLARMWGWWTRDVLKHPLLWVLHLGHASVGVGLLLAALPALGVPTGTSPLHLVTAGGIGLLTIGMMARVSLGHTGRVLTSNAFVTAAFVAVALAATARAAGPWLDPAHSATWWWVAAALWSVGFVLFVGRFAGILTTPRPDGRPG